MRIFWGDGMGPKVSVIVPVYRTEAYLKRCVDSLLNQTLQDIQIILVDDGSPDSCPALCDQLAREDERILVIHQVNAGAGPARNAGLAEARGEYVGFVDSDDYVLPEMYERLYSAAQKYDADMVLSGIRYLDGIVFNREGHETAKNCFVRDELFEGDDGIKRLLLGVVGAAPKEPEDSRYGVSACKNIYRNRTLRDHKICFLSEREVASEDTIFLLDCIPCCRRAVGVPGAYYCYCRNEESFSKSYRTGRFALQKRRIEEMEKRLAATMPEMEYRDYLDRQMQACARVASIQEIEHGKQAGLSRGETARGLRNICGDPRLAGVLRRYPYWQLPRMQAAFAFAMRYRSIWLQRLLVSLRSRL